MAVVRKLRQLAPWWACYGRTARDLITFCNSGRRTMSAAPVRAAVVYVAKATGDDTTPFMAYRSLVLQDYGSMLPSIQALNRQLLDNQIRNPTERYVRTLLALEKHEITRIQVGDVFEKAAEYRVKVKALAMQHAKQIWKVK